MPTRAVLAVLLVILMPSVGFAQEWDNIIYAGNKVSWSGNIFRFSGEYQVRLKENITSLDNHYLELTATWMANDYWEIVPDFRAAIFPGKMDLRPGLGVIFKLRLGPKDQWVQQLKWQTDFTIGGEIRHAWRYAWFYNHAFNSRYFLTSGLGFLHRISESFTGVEYLKAYAGVMINFNTTHSLNVTYLLGFIKLGTPDFRMEGGPTLQYTFRFDIDYEFTPAPRFSF